jgi:hypothetical protein
MSDELILSDPLLQLYMGYTLVDITQTKITNAKDSMADPKGRNKQRNWETLVQVLSLRAQPIVLEYMGSTVVEVSDYAFGSAYAGKHRVWSFKFGVEHGGVYDGNRPFSVLETDCNKVPVIAKLDETILLTNAIFSTEQPTINIYFTATQNINT